MNTKQTELTDEKLEVVERLGDASADFLTLAMRDLPPAAVAEMNRRLADGTGHYRLTTEASAAGLRVFAQFVTEQGTVPLLDFHVGDTEPRSPEATPHGLH